MLLKQWPERARGMALVEAVIRKLLVVLGVVFVATGIVGIFVPILPTTPFLLLAAACFASGSKRLYDLLLGNRFLGSYIRDYREGRGLPLTVKAVSIFSLWVTIGYSALFLVPWLAGKLMLAVVAVAVTIHLVLTPTRRG